MAERCSRELQEPTRTMLIHANRRCPKSVRADLWTYFLCMAYNVMNKTPTFQNSGKKSPQAIFFGSQVDPNSKHWKTYGCPVYILDNTLQDMQPHHKWTDNSIVGVYLGTLPTQSHNVEVVISLKTGLISPQLHVKFDTQFQTVGEEDPPSQCQLKVGFVAPSGLKPKVATFTLADQSNDRYHYPEGAPRRSKNLKRSVLRGNDPN